MDYINKDLNIKKRDLIKRITKENEFYLSKWLYVPNANWESQIIKINEVKAVMTPARDLLDLIIDLKSETKLYDGNEDLINTTEKAIILDNIAGNREPRRGESLDNYFIKVNGKFLMRTEHVINNAKIESKKTIPIHSLQRNCWTSFECFDENGLAIKLKGNEVYFHMIEENCISKFYAKSFKPRLSCCCDPNISKPYIGVRAKFYDIADLEK